MCAIAGLSRTSTPSHGKAPRGACFKRTEGFPDPRTAVCLVLPNRISIVARPTHVLVSIKLDRGGAKVLSYATKIHLMQL